MQKEYSPFTPGIPVPKELFVGREREIEKLRSCIAKAAQGYLQVAFLTGERGIGKSSLASFVKILVENESKVLGIHAFLGGVTTLEEMVRRVFDQLLKDSIEKVWYEKIKEFFGDHIRQIGAFGLTVEFKASHDELKPLVRNFDTALRNLLKRLKGEKQVIFIVIDDINGLANSYEFANWFKSLVDGIATNSQPLPLCILFVGYEERRQSLVKLQPSLARIFELFNLPAWTNLETQCFFTYAFNKVNIPVGENALELMAEISGGIPVFAQEIGDAVFKEDKDDYINNDDAVLGASSAAEIIGRKILEVQVIQGIRKSIYLPILYKIVRKGHFRFNRNNVRHILSEKEMKNFDNFLKWMYNNGVLVRIAKGEYEFTNQLYFWYFQMRLSAIGRESLVNDHP